jgi:hypothetical protein
VAGLTLALLELTLAAWAVPASVSRDTTVEHRSRQAKIRNSLVAWVLRRRVIGAFDTLNANIMLDDMETSLLLIKSAIEVIHGESRRGYNTGQVSRQSHPLVAFLPALSIKEKMHQSMVHF